MCKARHWAAASGLRCFPVAAMRQAAIGHWKLNFEPGKWKSNKGEQNHNYKNLSKCNSVLSQFVKKSKLGTTIVVRPIVTTAPGTVNSSYRCQSLCQLMALERVFPFSFVFLTIQRIQTHVWVSQKFSLCPCQIQMFAKIETVARRGCSWAYLHQRLIKRNTCESNQQEVGLERWLRCWPCRGPDLSSQPPNATVIPVQGIWRPLLVGTEGTLCIYACRQSF